MATWRRNSLRHSTWNYSAVGYYFVTICTHRRIPLFASAEYQTIVANAWQKIPAHKSPYVIRLDQWVIMPDHFHGIIVILTGAPANSLRPIKTVSGSLGALIGTFKASVTKRINHQRNTVGARIWHRGYYDRIIRDERALNAVRRYIYLNPIRAAEKRDNLNHHLSQMHHTT